MFRAKSTLEQWRILQSVVDYGGYAKAAEKLNKSQSSLNHAVAKLQTQLGIQLLEIKGRKAFLTNAGETMLRRARQILQDVEALESLADTLNKGWEPEITCSVELIYPKEILYQILKQFLPQSRGSRIKIIDAVISGSEEAINEKTVDLAITNIVPKGHLANTLCSVKMIPVTSINNTEISSDEISQDQLANSLQIVISDTGKAKRSQGWLKAEQRWTVANFHEALSILATDIGFCWIPESIAKPYLTRKEIRKIKIKHYDERHIPLHLVIPDRDNVGPATLLLEKLFYQYHQLEC
nr:LysR family transcriptional regulator [Thalassotalea atypica]